MTTRVGVVDGGKRKKENKTGSLQVFYPHSPEVRTRQTVGKGVSWLIWTALHVRSHTLNGQTMKPHGPGTRHRRSQLWGTKQATGTSQQGRGRMLVPHLSKALTCFLGWDLSKPKRRLGFLLCRRRSAALKGMEKPWMVLQKSVVIHRYGAKASTKMYWEWRDTQGRRAGQGRAQAGRNEGAHPRGAFGRANFGGEELGCPSHPSPTTLSHTSSAWHTPPLPPQRQLKRCPGSL